MKFNKLTKALCVTFFMGAVQQSIASGIPVVDGANLSQNLMNYIQYLKDYSQQLMDYTKQIEMLKQQTVDSVKDAAVFYQDAAKIYMDIQKTANGIISIRNEYESAMDYISKNYGDSEFWVNCAKTGCNPFQRVNSAADASINDLMYSLGSIHDISERISKNSSNTSQIIDALNSSGQGINQTLGKMAELVAELQQTQAGQAQMLGQALAAQNAVQLGEQQKKKYQEEKNKMFFQDGKIESGDYEFDYRKYL